jgi:predicted  nucleic acid-binding Zn-ribbon protein
MSEISDLLKTWDGERFAEIIHVGQIDVAGLQAYDELSQKTVIAPAGIPWSPSVRESAHRQSPRIVLAETNVCWSKDAAVVHRYSPSFLSGYLRASGLRSYYPRMQTLGSEQAVAVEFGEWLQGVMGAEEAPALRRLLVIDVPGCEHRLLKSASSLNLLQKFERIALRGARIGLYEDGDDPAYAETHLRSLHFKPLSRWDDARALWLPSVYEFDASEAQIAELKQALAAAEEGHSASQTQLLALRAEHEDLRVRLASRNAEVEAFAQKERQLNEALNAERAARAAGEADLGRRLSLAEEKCAALSGESQASRAALKEIEAALQGRDSELEALKLAHEDLVVRTNRRMAEFEALARREKQLSDELADERKGRATLERDLGERARQLEAALKSAADASKAQQVELQAVKQEMAVVAAARNEQAKAAAEARQRIGALEAELADLRARHALLQEELIKGEAQIELIADLVLRDPLR